MSLEDLTLHMWPTHFIPLLDKAGREAWYLKCGLDPQHRQPWELTRNADSESPQVHEILWFRWVTKFGNAGLDTASVLLFYDSLFIWIFSNKCLKSFWHRNRTHISCITLENLLNILESQFPPYKIAIIPPTPYFLCRN